MCDPSFEKNYPISHDMYLYRSSVEVNVIKRADYIGSTIKKMKNVIVQDVKSDAVFLKSNLAIGEKIFDKHVEKKFDFVYYAANISKAFDLALEGFAIAHERIPNITLLVVGAYDAEYKNKMDARIKELSLEKVITFTGRLPTHDDVLNKIRESRFALIPLKIDIISGTIRESMANGLPVVTTITDGGTPMLNETRETVLLSPIGDHEALANNMLRLLNDSELASRLKKNGYIRIQERYSNASLVQQQKRALLAAYENFTNGTPIPQDVLS
jgi:glycosyltransferase involved in cell wall biosynthesis